MGKSSFALEWDAHEYEHKERNPDWFWAAGIITLGLALAAFIFGNIIFGILIIVAAFSLAIFINRPPENIHVVVDERGLARGKILYPFETLEAFWIDTEHPHKKILLKSKKVFMPLIIVPLNSEADTKLLRDHLSKELREEYYSLPLVEKILEYLGF